MILISLLLGLPTGYWIIAASIYVNSDLTIEPGTVVKFRPGYSIHVGQGQYGSLKAVGTPEEPILFTSAASNPSPGDWSYLYFWGSNSENSSLKYCTIEYGGQGGYGMLIMENTKITLNNCKINKSSSQGVTIKGTAKFNTCENNIISDCESHPVEANVNSIHTLGATNQIISNPNDGIHVMMDSDQSGVATWQKFDAPYILAQTLYIAQETVYSELTIVPGCVIKFEGTSGIAVGLYPEN